MFTTMIEMSHITHTDSNEEYIMISTHVDSIHGHILSHTDYIHKDCTTVYDWEDAMQRFETFAEAPDTVKTYDKMVPNTTAHFTTYTLKY